MNKFFRNIFMVSALCIIVTSCTNSPIESIGSNDVSSQVAESSGLDKETSSITNEQITEVITKYVNDYENNQDLAVSHFFKPELIESNKLIEIKDCDQRFASVTNYAGKYTSAKAFLVTYDIRYKSEAQNLVTEESGIKTKYFVLIETEKGWLIDSIGY